MKLIWFWLIFASITLAAEEEILSVKLERYNQVSHQKKKFGKEKRELTEEILAAIPNGVLETPDFRVTSKEQLSIHTTLENARKLGATKMVEQVDKEQLKQLYLSGIPIEGVEKRLILSCKPKKQAKSS